jgi:hypothetical protein
MCSLENRQRPTAATLLIDRNIKGGGEAWLPNYQSMEKTQ